MKFELKTRQICLFFIAFLPISKLFTMPSIVAGISSEDAFISILVNAFFDLITLSILIFACKKAKMGFFDILKSVLGNIGAKCVVFLYFIFFMLKAVLPINETKEYVEFTLYTLLPTTFYFLPFFIVAVYFCTKRLRLIGRLSDVAWLITLIGLFLLFTLSISNADFTAILPIGAQGVPKILRGSFSSLPWFGDSVYLMFFIGEFAYQKKDGIKIFLSYLLGIALVVIFIIIFYCIFTSIAHRQRFALTEISKYTTVINNTGRFDYIGILLILLSNIFTLSIPLFFATRMLNFIFNFKLKCISPIIVVGLQFILSTQFSNMFASIENFIINYASFYFFALANVLPVLTIIFSGKEKKYELQKS